MQAKIIYFNPYLDDLETDLKKPLKNKDINWVLNAMEELDRLHDERVLQDLKPTEIKEECALSSEEEEARELLKQIMSDD